MTASKSVGRTFKFFVFLGRRTGKTRVFAVLGLIPVALAVVVRVFLRGRTGLMADVSTEILMVFFLQFYIVLLALFYGTSVTAEEVENRTLSYLITRPLPKPAFVLGKFAAYAFVVFMMVAVSLALSYFVLNAARLGEPGLYATFLRYLGVLGLGILAYMAFFTFLGTVLKRAIIVGLMFGFGWENVIQYFPGSTQRFSIVHYLKSLLPYHAGSVSGGKGVALLLFRLEPTDPFLAALALAAITAVLLALACVVFRPKEYLFED
ncbi:MAG: ABC transporter permease subunit [Candidatus Aminicenantes bacterium]|nr:ABC transporter permease subunit [Candidatus Aminicenantes bacterium]